MGTAVLLLLSACGGGTSTQTAVLPLSTLSQISASNSTQLASNAYGLITSIGSLGNSLADTSVLLAGVSADGATPGVVKSVLALFKRAYANGAPALLTGISTTRACAGGGSYVANVPSDRLNGPINGDNVSFTASHCVEAGTSIDGAFSALFSNVTGNLSGSGAGAATIDMTFNGLSFVVGTTSDTVTGDMTLMLSQTSSDNVHLITSGTSLQIVELNAGEVSELRMSDYTADVANSGGASNISANFTLTVTSGTFGQASLTVKTLQPFVSSYGNSPSVGSMIVYDVASSVTATVVPVNKVRIDYSAKGDGIITQTNTLDWATYIVSR